MCRGELRHRIAAFKVLLRLCLHAVEMRIVFGHHLLKGCHRWSSLSSLGNLSVHLFRVGLVVAELLAVVASLVCLIEFLFDLLAEGPDVLIHTDKLVDDLSLLLLEGFITNSLLAFLTSDMDAL